jgi:hypothetical protein
VEIKYTADENGFVAEGELNTMKIRRFVQRVFDLLGDALPLPVPLPEANLKALAEFEAAYATGKI